MKKLLTFLFLVASVAASAETVIERTPLGSGTPGMTGLEKAYLMPNDYLHFTPQYMPGFPTAATIWPRVVTVECQLVDGVSVCKGYNWLPEMGRGEYLFFRKTHPTPPTVITQPACVTCPVITKFVEVPVKPKSE
jgi:hypothetical protein